jgi:hypothetical protein
MKSTTKNPNPEIFKDSDGNPLVSGKPYNWQGEVTTFEWEGEVIVTPDGIQVHSSEFLITEDGEKAELPDAEVTWKK